MGSDALLGLLRFLGLHRVTAPRVTVGAPSKMHGTSEIPSVHRCIRQISTLEAVAWCLSRRAPTRVGRAWVPGLRASVRGPFDFYFSQPSSRSGLAGRTTFVGRVGRVGKPC